MRRLFLAWLRRQCEPLREHLRDFVAREIEAHLFGDAENHVADRVLRSLGVRITRCNKCKTTSIWHPDYRHPPELTEYAGKEGECASCHTPYEVRPRP